ncbi:hypothetical protein [Halorubrum cibi]|uniref:Uncharacterized protein n=1 Tax=Halorubrum cibi TaxID=413815 RepID=A0A521EEV9_9EURY|nr:hypothetical protein [Halorubrum cibi]SMO82392.1 hypothetical protein SAMN06264867_11099 [Halorubrum cibi]
MTRHTDGVGTPRHDAVEYGGAVIGSALLAGCIGDESDGTVGEESFDREELAGVVNGGEE